MSKVTVFVGVDYHQDSIQVCVMDAAGTILANRRVGNSTEEVAAVVLPHGDDVRLAVEACSGTAALADERVARWGWSVDMAHPGYVARIKQSPDKTDCSDARLLADAGPTRRCTAEQADQRAQAAASDAADRHRAMRVISVFGRGTQGEFPHG